MKHQDRPSADRSKTVPITALSVTASLIFLMGAAFSVYSTMGHISFAVLNFQVPGAVWGMVMMFLGVRYFVSVQKLKAEVYKSTTQFSWDHFKTEKAREHQRQSNRRKSAVDRGLKD